MAKKKNQYVWIIEYHGLDGWEMDCSTSGHFKAHRTRMIARFHMKHNHDCHDKDLRVKKYVSESK